MNLARLRNSPLQSARIHRATSVGVINKQYGYASNRSFDVSAAELFALSATGFDKGKAMPDRTPLSGRAFSFFEG
jgi:methylphosphotriester-DNA--protein-cysteine methyltransferase